MKQFMIISVLLLLLSVVHAQTWDEIFRQKKTQKKYLLEQIAALKTYTSYLQKGYKIATDGLNTVESIKKRDFNLHGHFFASLGIVSPAFKHYERVAAIIAMQISIAKQVSITIKQCRNSGQLTAAELNYLQSVFNRLLDGCTQSLNELSNVISDGKAQMKTDERIRRIDAIYTDLQEKQVFVQNFSYAATGLAMQRNHEVVDIVISKKLNSVK